MLKLINIFNITFLFIFNYFLRLITNFKTLLNDLFSYNKFKIKDFYVILLLTLQIKFKVIKLEFSIFN